MNTYSCEEALLETCNNSHYYLHTHDEYEIYMFLEGDTKYIIEEKTYPLEKDDIIIIRKGEMHRAFHNSPVRYHRLVLMISPQFFKDKNCEEYETVFLKSGEYTGNKIDSHTVHKSGLYDAIMRLRTYSDNFTNIHTPLTDAVITEILYIINKAVSFSPPENNNRHIEEIISYINANYTKKITLDMLSEKFFISKYHLCRIFKKATGLTVHDYIRNKRIIRAEDLLNNGYNMTEAAMLAGFNDYSSFYRAKK